MAEAVEIYNAKRMCGTLREKYGAPWQNANTWANSYGQLVQLYSH